MIDDINLNFYMCLDFKLLTDSARFSKKLARLIFDYKLEMAKKGVPKAFPPTETDRKQRKLEVSFYFTCLRQ